MSCGWQGDWLVLVCVCVVGGLMCILQLARCHLGYWPQLCLSSSNLTWVTFLCGGIVSSKRGQAQRLFRLLLMSHLLMPHWPKEVWGQNSESRKLRTRWHLLMRRVAKSHKYFCIKWLEEYGVFLQSIISSEEP